MVLKVTPNGVIINMDQMDASSDSDTKMEKDPVQDEYEKILSVVENRTYLPTKRDNLEISVDPNIIKLVYLTLFSESSHFTRFPFSEDYCRAFDKAKQWKIISSRALSIGLIVSTILTAVPFLVAIPKVSAWAEQSSANNLKLIMGIVMVGVVANIINFIATGIFPNVYTTTIEDKGIYLDKMKNNYKKMAKALIKLSKEKQDLAVLIAQKIDVDKIKKVMNEKQFTNISEYIDPLKKAISLVKVKENI